MAAAEDTENSTSVGEEVHSLAFAESVARESRHLDIQRRRHGEQMAYELEWLEHDLQRWSAVCTICMAVGLSAICHLAESCPAATAEDLQCVLASLHTLLHVKWEPYAGYLYCRAPQAICDNWVETSVQGRFERRRNGSCQFKGVLEAAVAVLLALRCRECTHWVRYQMQTNALVEGPEKTRLFALLGKRIKMSDRDASYMARFLYAWEEGRVHMATKLT
jgi:hypothetical protein